MFKHKRIVAVILFIVSWSYLIFKLCTYDEYYLLFSKLTQLDAVNYLFLLLILLLMPLNLLLEVIKWHISVNYVERQSFYKSFKQVILGNAGAFITPYRLGEHPSRAYYLDDKKNFFAAVVLGFVGSLALEIINVGLGLPAAFFYFLDAKYSTLLVFYMLVLAFVLILFIFIPDLGNLLSKRPTRNEQTKTMLETVCSLNTAYLLNILFLSLLRYLVYSLQFYLALRFFDITLNPLQALIAIPTYYMLVSVTPSLPIADAAIRGSWGILVFQAFTYDTPSIAFAAVMIWLINTALPLIAVPFLRKD